MATATYPGRRGEASARIHLSPGGQVTVSSATHEIGTGTRTVMTQVAADASGLPMNRITFACGDSSLPPAPYTGASQTSATVGPAVSHAALLLRQELVACDSRSRVATLRS